MPVTTRTEVAKERKRMADDHGGWDPPDCPSSARGGA
jgi:hypothetical protein